MKMMASDDSWFLVLPDHEAAAKLADGLEPRADRWVSHPSGRPWLLTAGRNQDVVVADMPRGRVAVIGQCPITADELARRTSRLSGLLDLDGPTLELPGSFHLLATRDGETRVQGTLSGLRRIFHGSVDDVPFASDRADIVAAVTGAEVDTGSLALWLLFPGTPAPLSDASPWHGVHKLPPDACLHLDRSGTARERTWWQPPDPTVSVAQGAQSLAEALVEGMAAFTGQHAHVGADLSGGLDSTSLCFLAAGAGAHVNAVTYVGRDPGNDDIVWAESAADELASRGAFTHQVLRSDQLPSSYAGLWQPGEPMDEPFVGLRDAARLAFGVRRAGQDGARYHLSGFGADEVLQAPSAALHTIVRRHPSRALSHIRGHRSIYRWPLGPVLGAMADRRSYSRWLADASAQVDVFGSARDTSLALHWDGPFRVPPWVAPAAVDSIRRLMRESAAGAQPLAPTRGQHGALAVIRRGAAAYRLVQRFVDRTGHRLRMPFLDDRVLRICLSIRLDERTTPWRYKPLLVEAMRDVVPADALSRTTKGNIASELYAGVRRYRPQLADLLDDPLLARLGLVDADALRNACLGLYPPKVPIAVLESTLVTEVWLRAVTAAARPSLPTGR